MRLISQTGGFNPPASVIKSPSGQTGGDFFFGLCEALATLLYFYQCAAFCSPCCSLRCRSSRSGAACCHRRNLGKGRCFVVSTWSLAVDGMCLVHKIRHTSRGARVCPTPWICRWRITTTITTVWLGACCPIRVLGGRLQHAHPVGALSLCMPTAPRTRTALNGQSGRSRSDRREFFQFKLMPAVV